MEIKLAEIWTEVLEVENVGVNDNFFELGGHSLKATSIVSRIHKALNVAVPLREIFINQTIRQLAGYIATLGKNMYSSIMPVEEMEYYPVSSAQKRLYILNRIGDMDTVYNLPAAMVIEGNLERSKLEGAFKALVERHESLRTSFDMIDGEPVQRIHKAVAFSMEYRETEEKQVESIIKEFIRPFDLSKEPLLRVLLLKLSGHKYILAYDMHHIISDGTSSNILLREFMELYEGRRLSEQKLQYKDFSVWQNALHGTDILKKQEDFWLNSMSGTLPVLNLCTDYPRPGVQSFEGDRLSLSLHKELSGKLKAFANQTGTTVFMVLLSLYNTVLMKYSGQDDIIVGMPIAGRHHSDLENVVGMFVNTLPMRNYPAGNKTFMEFLNEVKENTLKTFDNQDYQFEELVRKLNLDRDLSRNPVFDAMFIMQNVEMKGTKIDDFVCTPLDFENKVSKVDITLEAIELEECIHLNFEYCTRIFKKETMERLASGFVKLLEEAVGSPNKTLLELDMLTEENKLTILERFNDTYVQYPKDVTIHELFGEQAKRKSHHTALVFGEKEMTYGELDLRASQVAWVLKARGISSDCIVGLMVDRSFEMIIGILAILKAGGAYLPIDPEYPEERIRYMLEDSGAKVLLTKEHLVGRAKFEGAVICLEDHKLYENEGFITDTGKPHDLAYVIYTSGSTGKPKGVMLEHQAVNNFIKGMTDIIDFSEDKTILALTTICFDIFALETLLPLTKGLKVVIANEEQQRNMKLLRELITTQHIDILQITPSRMNLLLDNGAHTSSLNNLKEIVIGGEALPDSLFEALSVLKNTKLYNVYGPTETTVWSTAIEITGKKKITIGKPIANTQIYIVDDNNNLQPIGVAGELCIAGDGLARGYFNRKELTEEKFVLNPFAQGKRMYRTGDLARWLPDGDIEFIGRADNQVKIRGFRIELGEIESQLLKLDGVKETVVIAKDGSDGYKSLCAYIVAQDELSVQEIREHLLARLPDYMVPSYFVQLEKMPLTPNGKLNRRALPEPEGNIDTGIEYQEPRNEIEEKLIEIWSRILGAGRIGINDSFFNLGGSSMSLIQAHAQIDELFPDKVSVSDLFSYHTISKLADYIGKEKNTPGDEKNAQGIEKSTPIDMESDLDKELENLFASMEKGNMSAKDMAKNIANLNL